MSSHSRTKSPAPAKKTFPDAGAKSPSIDEESDSSDSEEEDGGPVNLSEDALTACVLVSEVLARRGFYQHSVDSLANRGACVVYTRPWKAEDAAKGVEAILPPGSVLFEQWDLGENDYVTTLSFAENVLTLRLFLTKKAVEQIATCHRLASRWRIANGFLVGLVLYLFISVLRYCL